MATLAAAEAAPPLHKHYYALGERCTARAHTAAVEPRAPAAPSAASSTPRERTPLPLNATGRNPPSTSSACGKEEPSRPPWPPAEAAPFIREVPPWSTTARHSAAQVSPTCSGGASAAAN